MMTREEFIQIAAEEISKCAKASTDETLYTLIGMKIIMKITERIFKNE